MSLISLDKRRGANGALLNFVHEVMGHPSVLNAAQLRSQRQGGGLRNNITMPARRRRTGVKQPIRAIGREANAYSRKIEAGAGMHVNSESVGFVGVYVYINPK